MAASDAPPPASSTVGQPRVPAAVAAFVSRRRRTPLLVTALAGGLTVAAATGGASALARAAPTVSLGKAVLQAQLLEVEEALKKGQWPDVIAALEEALLAARRQAPLVIRTAEVVRTPHTGLGIVDASPGGRVLGRTLRLYVELDNVDARPVTVPSPTPSSSPSPAPVPAGGEPAPALFEQDLEVTGAFFVEEPEGGLDTIGSRTLGRQVLRTRRPTGVHSLGLEMAMGPAAPPGPYRVRLKVRDHVSGKQAEREVRFILGG